jgi:AbrB family looped-hinge helix DNA binding protein
MSKASTTQNKIASLLRVLRAGQITLPIELRRQARISEGDYLEAAATEEGILLKPVSVMSREDA